MGVATKRRAGKPAKSSEQKGENGRSQISWMIERTG